MRNILFFLTFLLCVSCNNTEENKTTTPEPQAITNMDWLLGSWERMEEEEGKITHEHWNKISDKEYKGLGCTMVGKDTIWQENMRLIEEDDSWNFEVSVTGDKEVTIFEFTDITKSSFTCENENNEFPKKIEYHKDKEYLKAKISGGGPEVPFQFKKM